MDLINNREDKDLALRILADAYSDAQNVSWMLLRKNSKSLKLLFKVILLDAIAKKGAYITSKKNGAFFLYPKKRRNISVMNLFRKIHLMLFVTGIKRGLQAIRLQKKVAKIRSGNGLVGMTLAILQDENQMRAIFEVRKKAFEISSKTNMPIFAETTIPRYRLLYKSIGFKEYHCLKHPYADLDIWFLKREPGN